MTARYYYLEERESERNTPNVRFDACFFTLDGACVERNVDSGVGRSLVRVEVLNKGGIGVEIRARRVPTQSKNQLALLPPHKRLAPPNRQNH